MPARRRALVDGRHGLIARSVAALLPRTGRAPAMLVAALLSCGPGAVFAAAPAETPGAQAAVPFRIPAGPLDSALDAYGEQSGLQVIYDPGAVRDLRAQALDARLSPAAALDRLLRGLPLRWMRADAMTIVLTTSDRAPAAAPAESPAAEPSVAMGEGIAQLLISADPHRVLPTEGSELTFGLPLSVLETPRSIHFASSETIDLLGLSAVEDLTVLLPGVFTTTRFGIQGSADVRTTPGDTYFRGMKRLTLQGNGRSVLAAMDRIEVAGGPASPLYGLGKIGGLVNLVPKAGRARDGGYLEQTEGFLQAIGGSYDRRELSGGFGGPLPGSRPGGYYVYGLVEDSASYAVDVPVRQRILQAALSADDVLGRFRLETGLNYQWSQTTGALTGRMTQELAAGGRYIRGTPLVPLDANGNGEIDYLEMNTGSPVAGRLTADNQPLLQTWAWPRDAAGQPLTVDRFPTVPGIPQAMYDWLVRNPASDPGGLLRAQGPGGPLPVSGRVPVGMALDPSTVGYDTLDPRRGAAWENLLEAEFLTAFVDFVDDSTPERTVKNQLFFDGMWQYKDSRQPFVQEQRVYVVEDRLTLSRRFRLPRGIEVDAVAATNLRHTNSTGRNSGTGDFSNNRADAMAVDWSRFPGGATPDTRFASPLENPDAYAGGYPWQFDYVTRFTEAGTGVLADIRLPDSTQLLLGARGDVVWTRNVDLAGTFNVATGTAARPGAVRQSESVATSRDVAWSYSASLSRDLGQHLRPYVTWGRSSILLDGNNNSLTNAVINAGPVGSAELREIGFKAQLADGSLFASLALYRQARVGLDASDDPALLNAYATASVTRGWEGSLQWAPAPRAFVTLHWARQDSRVVPDAGALLVVDARTLGFADVRDESGNVVFPAEAFLYGGRARIQLPPGLDAYRSRTSYPNSVIGANLNLQGTTRLGFTLGANHFSSSCTGRLCSVRLPSAFVLRGGLYYDTAAWSAKLDVFNVFDERYYRARAGETLGNTLAQVMPGRRLQFTVKWRF